MLIQLHKNATTTPAIRDYIRTCGKPVRTLARELGLNVGTVCKWRGRQDAQDVSHQPHSLQTTLSRPQELLVVELRKTLLLSLDDLTAITRKHICPEASRSAIGRLLGREGVSRLARSPAPRRGRGRAEEDLQGLRTRLFTHRPQGAAPDARRGQGVLPLCRY